MISAKLEKKGVRVKIGGTADDIMDEIAYTTYALLSGCLNDTNEECAKAAFADICVRVRKILLDKNNVDVFDFDVIDDALCSKLERKSLDGIARMVLDGMSNSVIDDDGMEDDLPDFLF